MRLNKFLLTLILTLSASYFVSAQQLIHVGINRDVFNYSASSQLNSNWCWAASIKMILNYYGIGITQEQIVARSYGSDPFGNLPNWTGSFQVITSNLNNWNVDNYGRHYRVASSLNWGAPTPLCLINELSLGRPVLVGYKSGPNSGHAVVITALSYIPTSMGPQIQTIVVRDPWPSRKNIMSFGRVEYNASWLAQRINAHWYVWVR